jgi:hypothetical protein
MAIASIVTLLERSLRGQKNCRPEERRCSSAYPPRLDLPRALLGARSNEAGIFAANKTGA